MDEVLNLMSKSAVDHYNRDFNDNFDWKKNTSWWWEDAPKGNREYFEKLLNSPGFFLNAEPQQDGIVYMKKLTEEGYDTRILTHPQWNGICIQEKEEWIKKYLPFFNVEKTAMVKDKWLLAGPNRILLDDNIENLTKWRDYGGVAIAFEHPFNVQWDGLKVSSHKEFYYLIKELE